jgi:hypothetical protein
MNCKFCDKETKNTGIKHHEIRCRLNPNRITLSPSYGMTGKKGANQFSKAVREGNIPPEVSQKTIQKILATKRKNGTMSKTAEQRQQLSAIMKAAVEKYPDSYTSSNRGRVKQIIVDGIKFQGQWEVDFYNWAKDRGLNPTRPKEGFRYNWNGERTYFPDFYIESLDLFVEVKGYETERDRAKWDQFPKKLKIIKEAEIKQIRKGSFAGL